jgi:hypothetical protein
VPVDFNGRGPTKLMCRLMGLYIIITMVCIIHCLSLCYGDDCSILVERGLPTYFGRIIISKGTEFTEGLFGRGIVEWDELVVRRGHQRHCLCVDMALHPHHVREEKKASIENANGSEMLKKSLRVRRFKNDSRRNWPYWIDCTGSEWK